MGENPKEIQERMYRITIVMFGVLICLKLEAILRVKEFKCTESISIKNKYKVFVEKCILENQN